MTKEKLTPQNNESLKPAEAQGQTEKIKSKLEKEASSAEKQGSKELYESRKTVESEAISAKEHRPDNSEKSGTHAITKAEKTRTYKLTMSRVQNQLSTSSRVFSKFIHNPAVEKTSAAASTTVARPSGLLGAGIVGFVGITFVMYFARKNGFEISNSYALVVVLFVGGWALGLILEFLFKLAKKAVR